MLQLSNRFSTASSGMTGDILRYLGKCRGCGARLHNDESQVGMSGYIPKWESKRTEILNVLKTGGQFKKRKDTQSSRLLSRLEIERMQKHISRTPVLHTEEDTTTLSTREDLEQIVENSGHLDRMKLPICQRCHDLQHKKCSDRGISRSQTSIVSAVAKNPVAWESIRSSIHGKMSVICLVMDVVDFPCSWTPEQFALLTKKDSPSESESAPDVIVLNRTDMLPRSVLDSKSTLERLKAHVRHWAQKQFPNHSPKVVFTSGYTGTNVNTELFETMNRFAAQIIIDNRFKKTCLPKIFLVGATNVGKSMLWSRLQRRLGDGLNIGMSSMAPGTTIGTFSARLNQLPKETLENCRSTVVDTPGMFPSEWIPRFLTLSEYEKYFNHQESLKPDRYTLTPGRCLFIGGLVRVDYMEDETSDTSGSLNFVLFVPKKIPIHVSNIEKADQIYQRNLGRHPQILYPPVFDRDQEIAKEKEDSGVSSKRFFPKLENALEMQVYTEKNCPCTLEIVICGMGWISISGIRTHGKIRILTPEGTGVFSRNPPLFPFAIEPSFSEKLSARKKKYFVEHNS